MTDTGFVKGQSDNVPKVNEEMLMLFFADNPDFCRAEIRGVKVDRSSRVNYSDSAVGYVEVKRDNTLCIVKCRITPEHKIHKKAYKVTAVVNEAEHNIISCHCEDCPASQGGCKHSIAFLYWLYRRNTEPSRTSVDCYWKRPVMAGIGTTIPFIKAADFGNQGCLPRGGTSFLQSVVETNKKEDSNSMLIKFFRGKNSTERLSLHKLACEFVENHHGSSAADFIKYCSSNMSSSACKIVEQLTREQSYCPLWHSLRYGRITASTAYAASKCKTLRGALTEKLLGARIKSTIALERGRRLEAEVLKTMETKLNTKFNKCGIYLLPQRTIFGASPDAITSEFVVEVKCPMSTKTFETYFSNDAPNNIYMAQVQLQMYFTGKTKGLFCIAHPDYESSKNVTYMFVNIDVNYCCKLLDACTSYWIDAIFDRINRNKTNSPCIFKKRHAFRHAVH